MTTNTMMTRNLVKSMQLLGLVGTSMLVACSSRELTQPGQVEVGGLDLALTVSGYAVDSVEVTISSTNPAVSRVRTLSVTDPNATISMAEHGLPAATYSIGLHATVVDDPATELDESSIACVGATTGVVVQAGETTVVNDLLLTCTVDGGQVQLAGGIRIHAGTEVEVGPVCRDVIEEAYVGTLRTSVGSSVELVGVPVSGARVDWTATDGEIAADGKSFRCPDAPARVTLNAHFATADDCSQEFSADVECVGAPVQLPSVLLSTGCTSVGIPALCSLSQDGSAVTANCGGSVYTGSINELGELALGFSQTSEGGATVEVTCAGTVAGDGAIKAACTRTSATPDTNPTTQSCNLLSDPKTYSADTCMDLPSTLDSLAVSPQGEAEGSDVVVNNCKVAQGACRFQAECDNNAVFAGTVTATGVSFTQSLTATADAQTPNPTTNNPNPQPAFRAGAVVNHTCNGTVEGTAVSGTCSAGNTGSGAAAKPATSIYDIEGTTSGAQTCSNLASASEAVFVLDSCDALKAEIGEPVCSFRQNNCLWELKCGNQVYASARMDASNSAIQWTMAGAACEATFDSAGNLTGNCTLASAGACQLGTKAAVPGGESCPALPQMSVGSHGCGSPVISCSHQLQHGCDYIAICAFGDPRPLVVAGQTSYLDGRSHFEFNGLGVYTCHVDQANQEEISSGDRAANEWYGQCVNPSGGQCRNNYNPATGSGFRGFRLYFGD